jgi:hypothetical protein
MIVNQDDWICGGCGDVKHPNVACDPALAEAYDKTKKLSAQTLSWYLTDHRHRSDGSVKSSLVPDCITEERTVVPTDLEKELALAYERCHKAEAKIIELQMELDKLKPPAAVDTSVMFLYGNHTTSWFDDREDCLEWVSKQRDNRLFKHVEMVTHQAQNLHTYFADTETPVAFLTKLERFFQSNDKLAKKTK